MKIKNTPYYSKRINSLPRGCQLCVLGRKEVIFVTGLCRRDCYYCPISDEKYKKDVTYANEWPTNKIKNIIKEAQLTEAKGAGLTGGDPLMTLDRTLRIIKALKKKFGKTFHIHLYTSFDLIDSKKLKNLYKAGLDELRFHPDIDKSDLWYKISLAKNFDWDLGIEIPAVPGKLKQTKKLIDFFVEKIKFLNINELEIADNKANQLQERGFHIKNKLSYAIKGSETLALKILKYCAKKYPKLRVHYCTAKLKDRVQLSKRIKLRAKNVAKDYDIISEEGTLIRGMIEAKRPVALRTKLMKKFKIPAKLIQAEKNRVLIAPWILEEIKENLNQKLKPAIVEEYPTWDKLKIEINYL
ncbi:radical SAM protein [Candidatus Woesearchaeota archaeon]|nr:MAG: radical SAM protein [Candidatus Woesearchaeota archaeon]